MTNEERVIAAAIRWYQVTWQRPRMPAEWSAGEIYNDWDRVHDLAIAVEALVGSGTPAAFDLAQAARGGQEFSSLPPVSSNPADA